MGESRLKRKAVVFWLGFWFWWEHPGVELGRFFASLAVVGTWGGQPPSGVVGGGPWVTWRCHRRPRADVSFWPGRRPRFFPGGSLRDKWLDRAGEVRPSWVRPSWARSCSFAAERLIPGLILAIYAVSVSSDRSPQGHIFAFESSTWIPSAVEPACGATKSHLR
jgi:hypothetical protein